MNTFPVYALGHDFGNADTCLNLINSGMRMERRIPSVSCIGSWRKVIAAAHGAGREVKDFVQANHYILEYDHQEEGRRVEKYIGQKVFDDGAKPMETHGDSSRYWVNNYNLEMLMVGSASLVADTEYGLHVVTGLPISIYLDDPQNAENVRNALLGTHRFALNGRQRVMHVLSVKVVMEGAGALIAQGSNQDVLQGVIDIGGRTTDLYVAKGQKPRPSNAKGFSMGVTTAVDRFNEKFREECGYSLSLETRQALLKQFVQGQPLRNVKAKQGGYIESRRIAALIDAALREVGQDIATAVVAAWDDILMDMDMILIVGGGAYYFAEDIQARLDQAKKAYKPEFANVVGYASLAELIAKRALQQTMAKGA